MEEQKISEIKKINSDIKKLKINKNIHLLASTGLTLIDIPVILSYHQEPKDLIGITGTIIATFALVQLYQFVSDIEDLKYLKLTLQELIQEQKETKKKVKK